MTYHPPEVMVEVDSETGRWNTDGLPMVYVPVHFFLNNHRAIEAELGIDRYAQILYAAGYDSAWIWCEAEGKTHGITGEDVVRHYLDRLSKRGWGQFSIIDLDIERSTAVIDVTHSIFADHSDEESHDYMFTGWFAGAMDQASGAHRGRGAISRQIRGEKRGMSARFEVTSVDSGRG